MSERTGNAAVRTGRPSVPASGRRRTARTALGALAVASLAGLSLGAIAGCSSPFESSDEDVRASAANDVLTIENRSDEPVYYFLVERNQVAAVSWEPCARPDDPEGCPRIPAGGQVQLPYSEVIGYAPGQEDAKARIYWWHLVEAGVNRMTADRVRYLDVELK